MTPLPAAPHLRDRTRPSASPTGWTAPLVARAFLDDVTSGRLEHLPARLADDVWTRVLLPRRLVEHHDAAGLLADLHEWFATPREIHLESAHHHSMAGREFVRYRFLLRPDWAPDTWHRIEQSGYLRVADGRIRRVDLVCTGFHPVDELA